MSDHFLTELVPLRELDHAVEDKYLPVRLGLEDENVLELRAGAVQDAVLRDLQRKALAGPHHFGLGEPVAGDECAAFWFYRCGALDESDAAESAEQFACADDGYSAAISRRTVWCSRHSEFRSEN